MDPDRGVLAAAPLTAGLRVSFINAYLARHFDLFPQEYRYHGEARNLGLGYGVTAAEPFRLEFKDRRRGPRGLRVSALAPKVDFEFRRLKDDALLGRLSVSAVVTVALILPRAADAPIGAVFESIDVTIGDAVIAEGAELEDAGCDLKELIEHLAEVIGGEYLAKYFDELEIPNPAQGLSEFSVSLTDIHADDDYLYIGASLAAVRAQAGAPQADAQALPAEMLDLLVQGVENQIVRIPRDGDAGVDLELHTDFRNARSLLGAGALRDCDRYQKGVTRDDLVLWISEEALEALVHARLNFEKRTPLPGSSGDWSVSGEYGYRVYDAHASLSGLGCIVRAEFSCFVGGTIKGRRLWNKWFSTGVTGGARVEPFLAVRCDFQQSPDGRQLRLRPLAFPFVVISWVHFSNPILWPVEFLLNFLINALGLFISTTLLPIISVFLNLRILDLPERLKGSPVPVHPLLRGVDEGKNAIVAFAELRIP